MVLATVAGSLLAVGPVLPAAQADEGPPPYALYDGMATQEIYFQPPNSDYEINIDMCFPAIGAGDTEPASGPFDIVLEYSYTSTAGEVICDASTYRELVRHGYAFAYVQWPGTGESAGGFSDLGNTHQAEDMVAATYFLADQPWSTGRIGGMGASGNGANVVNVAAMLGVTHTDPTTGLPKESPLMAIIPQVTTNNGYESFFPGGMQATWLPAVGCAATNVLADVNNGTYTPPRDEGDVSRAITIREGQAQEAGDRAANGQTPPCLLFEDYNNHPAYDDWWEADRGKLENIHVPVWVQGSFDDLTNSLTSEIYTGWGPYQRAAGPNNLLTMGFVSHVGASPTTEFNADREAVDFFDRWIRGIHNNIDAQVASGRFRYINQNEWIPRVAPDYPIPGTDFSALYLDSGASDPLAQGSLNWSSPTGDVAASYPYVPEDGIRGFSSGLARARTERQPANRESLGFLTYNDPTGRPDQRTEPAASRVAFLSSPMEQDTTLTGRPTMTLYAKTTSPDTDFVVRLIDVVPDDAPASPNDPQPGMWRVISSGRLKGTFRSYLSGDLSAYTSPTPIPTGEVVRYDIALDPAGWLVPSGHRIGVLVMSSDVPYTYPNLNPAVVTVVSSPEFPSHITLPVIPAGASSPDLNADGIADDRPVASDAPTITVRPGQGPSGSTVGVAACGFEAATDGTEGTITFGGSVVEDVTVGPDGCLAPGGGSHGLSNSFVVPVRSEGTYPVCANFAGEPTPCASFALNEHGQGGSSNAGGGHATATGSGTSAHPVNGEPAASSEPVRTGPWLAVGGLFVVAAVVPGRRRRPASGSRRAAP